MGQHSGWISASTEHALWQGVFILAVLVLVVSVILQRKALNKMAFGRSMFISGTALFTGLFISMLPSIPATIVAVILILIGYAFLILMAVKSWQHMRQVKRR